MVEINGVGAVATRGLSHISTCDRVVLELHYLDSPKVLRLRFRSRSAYYRAYRRLKGAMCRQEFLR